MITLYVLLGLILLVVAMCWLTLGAIYCILMDIVHGGD